MILALIFKRLHSVTSLFLYNKHKLTMIVINDSTQELRLAVRLWVKLLPDCSFSCTNLRKSSFQFDLVLYHRQRKFRISSSLYFHPFFYSFPLSAAVCPFVHFVTSGNMPCSDFNHFFLRSFWLLWSSFFNICLQIMRVLSCTFFIDFFPFFL